VQPGTQQVVVRFRTADGVALLLRTPQLALGSPATNVNLALDLPADRWLLATQGPALGPAVLYWSALVVLMLAAFGVSRLRRTPLRMHEWVLLGLGFSTFSWAALLLVVAWLFVLDARARDGASLSDGWFNFGQIVIAALSLFALLALLAAVPQGLLGMPDMQVEGHGSNAQALRWFADRSSDALPQGAALSVSIWWYKLAMLAWALWLASALVRWLRWAWTCFNTGGYWRAKPPAVAKPAPPPPVNP
jgi:hypothetical protein